MSTFAETKAGYRNLWSKCQIAEGKIGVATAVANKIIGNNIIYKSVEALTKVPWFLIGALHDRESGMNFNTYLGNGDPLSKPTVNVPKGRGPFASFTAGAVDALKYDKLAGVSSWSIELVLFCSEEFNGEGYELHHENSPYVWAGTNIQQRGKYTSDRGFDPNAWDEQLGVAAILKALCKLDNTVAAFCAVTQPQEPDVTTPTPPQIIPGLDFAALEPLVEQVLPLIANSLLPEPWKSLATSVGIPLVRTILHAQPPAKSS